MFLSSHIVTAIYVLYSAFFPLVNPHYAIIRQKNEHLCHSATRKKGRG
jgi:hypothetical protein